MGSFSQCWCQPSGLGNPVQLSDPLFLKRDLCYCNITPTCGTQHQGCGSWPDPLGLSLGNVFAQCLGPFGQCFCLYYPSQCGFSLYPHLYRICSTSPRVVFRDSCSICAVDTWVRTVCVHIDSDFFQLTCGAPTWIVQGSTGSWESAYAEGQLKLCMDFWLRGVVSIPSFPVVQGSIVFVFCFVMRIGKSRIFLLHYLDWKSLMLFLYNDWFINRFSLTVDVCAIKILMNFKYIYFQARKHTQF